MGRMLESAPMGAPVATGLANSRIQSLMNEHNKRGRRPLTPFEAKQLVDGEDNCFYIYNVSPIHIWRRPQGQLGTIVLQPRKWDESYNVPVTIKGALLRWVSGLGLDQPFIEGGASIAEDICGSGPLYDGRSPSSNLTNFGVFITRKPFDWEQLPVHPRQRVEQAKGPVREQLLAELVVPIHEQREITGEATQKLLVALQDVILQADNYHMGGPEQRKYVQYCDWYRLCLKAYNHITGRKESRPWASITSEETLTSCLFCGNQNKPGLAMCPNCKQVLDPEAFELLKQEIATRPKQKPSMQGAVS